MSRFGEVVKLGAADVHYEEAAHETVWLLLTGALEVRVGKQSTRLERHALFEEPIALAHVSAGAEVELLPAEACELLVFRARNPVVGVHRLAVSERVVAAGAWSERVTFDGAAVLHFRFATPEGSGTWSSAQRRSCACGAGRCSRWSRAFRCCCVRGRRARCTSVNARLPGEGRQRRHDPLRDGSSARRCVETSVARVSCCLGFPSP